jgi:hypothetical protein
MTHSPVQIAAAAYAVEQIHLTVDQLRDAWAWLAELTVPGPASPAPARAMTDEQAERLEARGHSDRAYRSYNLRHGMSALPPSPAAARVSVVDVQITVAQLVTDAVTTLTGAGHAPGHRVPAGGPRPRGVLQRAVPDVPALLDWISGCGLGLGHTGRDGMLVVAGAIATVRDPELAGAVEQLLARADRAARDAAGAGDDPAEQLVDETGRPARCPACGRRSLQREATRLIRCISASCRCTGDATPDLDECGCRRTEKRPGLPHVWNRATEDQLWAAIDDHPAPTRPLLGHGGRGHGGWQSRDMAGQQ